MPFLSHIQTSRRTLLQIALGCLIVTLPLAFVFSRQLGQVGAPFSLFRSTPPLTESSFQHLMWDGKWTKRPWTDEAPYQQINTQIQAANLEARVKKGEDPEKLLAPYRQVVVTHVGDPLPVYTWALATFYAAQNAKPRAAGRLWISIFPLMHHYQEPLLYSAEEPWHTMINEGKLIQTPHSYWFDRMMFIFAVEGCVCSPYSVDDLSSLADRLLKRNPGDREVSLRQIKMLQNSEKQRGDNTWRLAAVNKAQMLVKQNPNEPRLLLTLAETYGFVYEPWGQFTYSQKALQIYQRYIKLVPKDIQAKWIYRNAVESYERNVARSKKYKTRQEWLDTIIKRKA